MLCPRSDCELELEQDGFFPPGAYSCPKHGGPIWIEDEIQLASESQVIRSEREVFAAWLYRLAKDGKLRHSVTKDMSGVYPAIVTIENHGPEEIDIQFHFDPYNGRLMNVKAYLDHRSVKK